MAKQLHAAEIMRALPHGLHNPFRKICRQAASVGDLRLKIIQLQAQIERLEMHLNAAYDEMDTMRATITELKEVDLGRRQEIHSLNMTDNIREAPREVVSDALTTDRHLTKKKSMKECRESIMKVLHKRKEMEREISPGKWRKEHIIELEFKIDRLSTHLNAAYDEMNTMHAKIVELEEGRWNVENRAAHILDTNIYSQNIKVGT